MLLGQNGDGRLWPRAFLPIFGYFWCLQQTVGGEGGGGGGGRSRNLEHDDYGTKGSQNRLRLCQTGLIIVENRLPANIRLCLLPKMSENRLRSLTRLRATADAPKSRVRKLPWEGIQFLLRTSSWPASSASALRQSSMKYPLPRVNAILAARISSWAGNH